MNDHIAQHAINMAKGMDYRMRGLSSPTDNNIYQSTTNFTNYSNQQRINDKDRLKYVYDNQAGTQILSQVPLTQFISSDASPPRQRGLVGSNIAHIDHRSNLIRMSHNDGDKKIPSIASGQMKRGSGVPEHQKHRVLKDPRDSSSQNIIILKDSDSNQADAQLEQLRQSQQQSAV